MTNDYIRREDVLNLPQSIERNLRGEIVERSIDVKDVESLEPADVAPVVHAHWIDGYKWQTCSKCRNKGKRSWKFCPNCGAIMDGHREE